MTGAGISEGDWHLLLCNRGVLGPKRKCTMSAVTVASGV